MIECPTCGNELSQAFDHIRSRAEEMTLSLTADRDKWRDRRERLIAASMYIDSYDFAQAIQKEIDDEK